LARRRHQKKEVQEAIAYAIKRGWVLVPSKGHGHCWGYLQCPTGEDDVAIYTTPKNAGNHAKHIVRAVIRCPHRTGDT
jgi:hypothetical protein